MKWTWKRKKGGDGNGTADKAGAKNEPAGQQLQGQNSTVSLLPGLETGATAQVMQLPSGQLIALGDSKPTGEAPTGLPPL